MPTATITYTFSAGTTAVADQVNTNFADLLNFLNVTGLGADNIQANAIGASEIAAGAVGASEIADDVVNNDHLILSTLQDVASDNQNIGVSWTNLCTLATPVAGSYLVYGQVVHSFTTDVTAASIEIRLSTDTNPRIKHVASEEVRTSTFLATAVSLNGATNLNLQAQKVGTGTLTSSGTGANGVSRLIAVRYN